LVREFLNRDRLVGIIDGLVEGTGGTEAHLAPWREKLAFAHLERVELVLALAERLQWADCIVNAMAFTGHLVGFDRPMVDVTSNLLCHLHLIQALKGCKGKKVIYLGTRSQYGAVAGNVITEQSPCDPLDPQGINKLAAEHFFRIYARSHGFHTLSLRLTNCYGPQQRTTGETGLVGSFIQDTLADRPIEIFGNAKRRKNLLYAEDAARIIADLAEKPWEGFHVFNVGGAEVTIQELLEEIFRAAGKGSYSVKPFPEHVKRIDVGEARFCDDQLRAFLGQPAMTPLPQAIAKTVEYFRMNCSV
jgi:UDP-glucose 4-epimerase